MSEPRKEIKQPALEVEKIRADFPIFQRERRAGIPLIYLDSAATSQKPKTVIEAMDAYYRRSNANIHRGIHMLAEEATAMYEEARAKVAQFIHAESPKQIIFTRNTTEAINLVAYSWGRHHLQPGDVIVLTEMEHHSNLVPWQILAAERGVRLEFIPVTSEGLLDLDAYEKLLRLEPKLVSVTHMSNVLGTINPVNEITQAAKRNGATVLVDAAQSVPHLPVNVQEIGTDFLAFSGHKMCGPTGIGVLYGKREILEAMPPFLGGGDMIKRVHLRSFTENELPYKFEAGTPAIAQAIGLGEAVDYLQSIGMEKIRTYEHDLTAYALERIEEIPGVHVLGSSAEKRGGVVSFFMDHIHPHDISQILDRDGIAIRAGHHCAMPLHERFNLTATARASLYLYNTFGEIDALAASLYKVLELFK